MVLVRTRSKMYVKQELKRIKAIVFLSIQVHPHLSSYNFHLGSVPPSGFHL